MYLKIYLNKNISNNKPRGLLLDIFLFRYIFRYIFYKADIFATYIDYLGLYAFIFSEIWLFHIPEKQKQNIPVFFLNILVFLLFNEFYASFK